MANVSTSKKGLWGWIAFDWAAQPFFTLVTSFIFAPYVVSRMVENPAYGQAMWGYGIAAAGVIIAIGAPVLGAIADNTGQRKKWILMFAVFKIIAVTALWFAKPGSEIVWVIALFVIATVAAEFSAMFNDSMLPTLVKQKDMGALSNKAWGLGYIGGLILLILMVLFIAADTETGLTRLGYEPLFGLSPKNAEADRLTGPVAAIWYCLFIIPLMLFTPDQKKMMSLKKATRKGINNLRNTIHELKRCPGVARFLVARMIYYDGVAAIATLGGTFAAATFKWQTAEIGVFGIIINITAIIGCLVSVKLDKKFGSKWVVMTAIIMLIIATTGIASTSQTSTLFGLFEFDTNNDVGNNTGLFATKAEQIFVCYGLIIGLAIGPAQASSRSYLAQSIPPQEAGKYFGLYTLVGQATSFVAPFTVATVTLWTQSPRAGMATLLIFFVVGLAILKNTPYPANKTQ